VVGGLGEIGTAFRFYDKKRYKKWAYLKNRREEMLTAVSTLSTLCGEVVLLDASTGLGVGGEKEQGFASIALSWVGKEW